MGAQASSASWQPTPDQRQALDAVEAFLVGPGDAFLLTGPAGSGKTVLIRAICERLEAVKRSYRLAAPTGRAARVLGERTGRGASTIHAMIYAGDRLVETKEEDEPDSFVFNFALRANGEPFDGVYIVDEASMVGDTEAKGEFVRFGSGRLLKDLVAYAGMGWDKLRKIVFVGDPAQLPPVGDRLSPALDAATLEREHGVSCAAFELRTVMRQAAGGGILANAWTVRDEILSGRCRDFALQAGGEVREGSAVDLAGNWAAAGTAEGDMVVAWSNARVRDYNRMAREQLLGSADLPPQEGERLLVVRNNHLHRMMNGDFCRIARVGATERATVNGVELVFRRLGLVRDDGSPLEAMAFENLLDSDHPTASPEEQRALYAFFKIRHPRLKPGTDLFKEVLRDDPYFNALMVKYGYAVTCHKAQGGEWPRVWVDFQAGMGRGPDFFRWAYTAITRAKRELVLLGVPRFDRFSQVLPEVAGQAAAGDGEAAPAAPATTAAGARPLAEVAGDLLAPAGIVVVRVEVLQYRHRIHLARGPLRGAADVIFNGKGLVTGLAPAAGAGRDDGLSRQAVGLLAAAGWAGRILDDRGRVREDGPKANGSRQEGLLARLAGLLDGSGASVDRIESLQWTDRVHFRHGAARAQLDFTYNGRDTYTNRGFGGKGDPELLAALSRALARGPS